jgi:Secretion system C-terminal sorting domain
MVRLSFNTFNIKPMFYRVIIAAIIIAAPFSAMRAQSVTVAGLIPHTLGCYVDYNEYDTITAGSPAQKSHASYTITGIDTSNVLTVLDSIGGGNPSGIHQLYYYFTKVGDLQAYADTAFINFMIPTFIAAGVASPPDSFVDYIKLSAGMGNSYPIMVLNSNVTFMGYPLNIVVTLTGKYMGIDTVTASGTIYDSAYRFDINAISDVSVESLPAGEIKAMQSDWVVRGIGIIKTNAPIADTTIAGNSVTTDGKETEMTSFGIASPAAVSIPQRSNYSISFFPDPASDQVTLSFNHPANQIFLYNDAGQMIRSFQISSHTGDALLSVQDIPNGAYHVQIMFADGSSQTSEMVIRH